MPTHIDGIEQQPMHGVTFADSLTDAQAPERHTQQYFETIGNRAMYKDGWWLAMKTERIPWVLTPDALKPYAPGVWDPDEDPVELYYLPDDFTPGPRPRRRAPREGPGAQGALLGGGREVQRAAADGHRSRGFFGMVPPLPEVAKHEFRGGVQNVLSGMIPRIYNHSYAISADLVIPPGGAEGVIVAEADHLGGFSLFVDDGKLTHTYSMMGVFVFRQQAEEPLPEGEVTVRMEFAADAAKPATGGEVTLFIDDRPVGERPHGAHGADPLLRLRRAWTSAATTAASSTSPTRTASRSRSPARSRRSSSTSTRTPRPRRRTSSTPPSITGTPHTRSRHEPEPITRRLR